MDGSDVAGGHVIRSPTRDSHHSFKEQRLNCKRGSSDSMSRSPNFAINDALLGRVEANFRERLETCVRDNSRLLGHEVFKIRVNRVNVFF